MIETASAHALVYWQSPVTTIWIRSLVAAASACSVAACVLFGSRVAGGSYMRLAGKLTYGIYLWHMPVILFAMQSGSGSAVQKSLVVAGSTLLLAVLGWRLVEKPAIAYARRASRW